jgi:HEAT repeat protein
MTMNKNKKSKKPITAAELMAELDQDPEYVRHKEEKDRHFRALDEELARAEHPLVVDLNAAGFPVQSVWDLVNTRREYKQAIPVLFAHLAHPYPWRIREGIARALTVKYAGETAYRALLREFRNLSTSADEGQQGYKWALGNAISIVAGKAHYDDLVRLVCDKVHGTSRSAIILRLPKYDPERSVGVLIDLLGDNEVAGYALEGIVRLKVQKARPEIERLLDHPEPWVREEARKALAKLSE